MLDILYEDNHIIAVNKKISDIVQADKTGDTPLSEEVKAYIKNLSFVRFEYSSRPRPPSGSRNPPG